MSGHSKWHNIQKTKGAADAKRAQAFTKIAREMVVAVKEGGSGDPRSNSKLAAVIAKAKAANMPNDNIKRTIDKALGSGSTENYEKINYEGYGPQGVAVIVEALTDNRNRTAADVRAAFAHHGGNLGTSGSVVFQFERKGEIVIDKIIPGDGKKNPDKINVADEETLEMAVLEAGGDDNEDGGDEWIGYTAPDDLMAVKAAIEEQGIECKGAEFTMIATTPQDVTVDEARKVMRLVDKLEELEDLQNVYHTMNITDEIAEALDED